VTLFVVCFVLWLGLSGHWDALHVGLGAVAAALVVWLNRGQEDVTAAVRVLPRLLWYAPWLLREIVRSNVAVMRLVLDPRLPIDPVVVRVRAPVRDPLAVTTMANSITLTPGTITLDADGDELTVHALTAEGAAGIASTVGRRVARLFGESGSPR
jgi:multicomponent Na+:H+ antiporter subunit E